MVDPISLHVKYPIERMQRGFNPSWPSDDGESAVARARRDEKLTRLKELFATARRYDAAKKAGLSPTANPRLESLLPYVRGEKPVVFTANRKADILATLKLADELKVKPIISGGIEAWKVAVELKRRDVPVILGPIMTLPHRVWRTVRCPLCCSGQVAQSGGAVLYPIRRHQ